MLEHHIQKTIIYSLAHSDGLRFSELQPEGIENKLFNYHLKKVILEGLVAKNDEGVYALTAQGKSLWMNAVKDKKWFAELAHSVVFLIIRRKSDGAWLLARRIRQPLLGQVGLMYAQPDPGESIYRTATDITKQYAGLDLTFTYKGAGYLRMFTGGELDSFVHFTMLVCDDAIGEIAQNSDLTEFFWLTDPDFKSADMIKSMPALTDAYASSGNFFLDEMISY